MTERIPIEDIWYSLEMIAEQCDAGKVQPELVFPKHYEDQIEDELQTAVTLLAKETNNSSLRQMYIQERVEKGYRLIQEKRVKVIFE